VNHYMPRLRHARSSVAQSLIAIEETPNSEVENLAVASERSIGSQFVEATSGAEKRTKLR